MPIRLNLLAEAQAAEEMRRKDPVKRAIYFGGGCVLLIACSSLVLQSEVIATNRRAEAYNQKIQAITNDYSAVMQDQRRLDQVALHRRGLDILASERFLYGTFLNSLQGVYTEGVQMIHIRTDHNYALTDETRAKPSGPSAPPKVLKPATATEKIAIVIEARDIGSNPGDQVTRFKEKMAATDHFVTMLGTNNQMRLVNLSPPQLQPDTGRLGVQFTLEARLPEKIRLDITSPVRYGAPAVATRPGDAPKKSGTELSL
jgi:hypothetical protein